MKCRIYKTILVFSAAFLIHGCSKQTTDPLMDERPEVPVTIANAADYRPDPTVTTKLADGKIEIALAIPEQSGKKIVEITRIATANSYSLIQSASSTAVFYVGTPITVNGTSYTYTTSIAEYFSKNPVDASSNPKAQANKELAFRFYFLLKLDDGTQLVSMPVRVLVLP
jgi:hypothetical protein